MLYFNEIFSKGVTYDNIKSHNFTVSPLSRRYVFRETTFSHIVILRFFDWLAKYESLEDKELENIRKRDLIANQVEIQKDRIENQNDNIEELIAVLEEQTAMTQKIAQRLDI